MPKTIELSKTASVRHIALGPDNAMAAYLANLYIPHIDAHKGTIIHRYEVPNQIAGLHFCEDNANILYACDDSFGLHIIDLRAQSRRKIRLNPEVENHTVTCTALSGTYMAVASSTFGGGIADVRVGRRAEQQHPHVVTTFDARNLGDGPITTYARKHTAEISSMAFYKNGTDLLTGDKSGAVRSFSCTRLDEVNSLRWERFIKGPVTKVGLINKRIAYAVGDKAECNVFIDSKGKLEVLYGNVMESPNQRSKKPSPATYSSPNFCVGMVMGLYDELPLVSVWATEGQNKLHLTAINQAGVRESQDMAKYTAHEGEIKCMAVNATNLVTGGADGKIVIKNVDFRVEGGGKAAKSKKGDKSDKSEKPEKSDETEEPMEEEPEQSEKSDKADKSDKAGNSDKSEKAGKSEKSHKSEKTDKSEKSHKSEKTDKTEKSHRPEKSHKSEKTDKSEKSHRSEKSHKSDKHDKSERSEKSKKSHKSDKREKSPKSDSSDGSVKSEKSKKKDKHEKASSSSSLSSSSSSHKVSSKSHKSSSSKSHKSSKRDSEKPSSSRAKPY